jgi:hypothetical protein
MEQATVSEIVHFPLRIQAREQPQALLLAVGARDGALDLAPRRHGTGDIEYLIALERE